MVSPFLFDFFLKMIFSIQWCLRQFLLAKTAWHLKSAFDINRVSIRGGILTELRTSEADSTHFVHMFLKNHVFQPRTKIFTGQFSCPAFQPSSNEQSWWSSQSIKSSFLAPPTASWWLHDRDSGTLDISETHTLRLCKHSPNFSPCHFCIYQSGIGDEKEREKLVFVCIHGTLPSSWPIHIFGVWWWWIFSVSPKGKKCTCDVLFFLILCSHKCRIIYTRFHAFMLSPITAFTWWRKNGWVKNFLYNSCGTLIWVRITPVKVESGLIGIIHTYIIIEEFQM